MTSTTPHVHPDPEAGRRLLDQAALGRPSVSGLQVIVKQETPFQPKVAFTLITLASLAGATFTGTMAGLGPVAIGARWLSLWAIALAGGFAAWRVLYLRTRDAEAAQGPLEALNATALTRARTVGRWVAPIAAVSVVGPLLTDYLAPMPVLRWALVACLLGLAAALVVGSTSAPPRLRSAPRRSPPSRCGRTPMPAPAGRGGCAPPT